MNQTPTNKIEKIIKDNAKSFPKNPVNSSFGSGSKFKIRLSELSEYIKLQKKGMNGFLNHQQDLIKTKIFRQVKNKKKVKAKVKKQKNTIDLRFFDSGSESHKSLSEINITENPSLLDKKFENKIKKENKNFNSMKAEEIFQTKYFGRKND